MLEEKKLTKTQKIQLERTPKRAKVEKKDLSTFKMKDEHFEGRSLHYFQKGENGKAGTVPAVHRNISIARQKITCYPGEFLTKDQVGIFDDAAKAHWLVDTKAKKSEGKD